YDQKSGAAIQFPHSRLACCGCFVGALWTRTFCVVSAIVVDVSGAQLYLEAPHAAARPRDVPDFTDEQWQRSGIAQPQAGRKRNRFSDELGNKPNRRDRTDGTRAACCVEPGTTTKQGTMSIDIVTATAVAHRPGNVDQLDQLLGCRENTRQVRF